MRHASSEAPRAVLVRGGSPLHARFAEAPWVIATLVCSLLAGALSLYGLVAAVVPVALAALVVAVRKPELVLVVAVVLIPFNFESLIARIGIPFVNPFNLVWLAAVGVLVIRALRNWREVRLRTPLDLALGLNLLVTLVMLIRASAVVEGEAFSHAFEVWQQWTQWVLFFWIIVGLVNDRKQARMVTFAIVGMIVVAAFFGIKDYASTRAVSGGMIERSEGLFGQANYAGSFFAYYLPFLLALARCETRFVPRILLFACTAIAGTALVLTFSRGAMMALGLSVGLVILLTRSRSLLFIGLLGALFVAADPSVRARFSETTDSSTEVGLDASSAARLIAWKKAGHMVMEKPILGWGFYSFRHVKHRLDSESAALFGHGSMDVHNGHLNTAVSGGLMGIVGLYYQFGMICVFALMLRRRSRDPFVIALATGLLACVLAIMIVNMTGTRLYNRQVIAYFWMFLALAWVAFRAEGLDEDADALPSQVEQSGPPALR